jgi:hypothetical protein
MYMPFISQKKKTKKKGEKLNPTLKQIQPRLCTFQHIQECFENNIHASL